MPSPLLETRYQHVKERLIASFTALHGLAVQTGPADAQQVAAEAIASVHAPFLFVVVGEVKAGKSSLVNALLGEAVCQVAPEPCTDVIQKIIHGKEPATRAVSPALREIAQPADILKDIAIVDTPGTNTLIEQHQAITEAFIPQSDLVLFVFPATNPHTKSAWDFFDFVHTDWRKKSIFILQQMDRASAEELAVNKAKVTEYAQERGLQTPAVFAVSAKNGTGMEALTAFIRGHVTGGKRAKEKLQSCITTGLTVLDRIGDALEQQHESLDQDRQEEATIRTYLELARKGCQVDVDWTRTRLAEAYATHAKQLAQDFEDGLALPQMVRMTAWTVTGKKERMQQWLDGIFATFKKRLDADVEAISEQGGSRLQGGVTKVMETLASQLSHGAAARSREAAATSMSQTRLESLRHAREQVVALLDDATLDQRLAPRALQSMGEQAVAGGLITAMGAVIAAVTQAAVVDITGGLIALAGAVVAMNILAFRRRKSVATFRNALEQGQRRLAEEVDAQLTQQLNRLFQDLDLAFDPFFRSLAARDESLSSLHEQAATLRRTLLQEQQSLPEPEPTQKEAQ